MRVQLWKIGLAALVTGALITGCNIFGSNEPVPGEKADQLGQQLADFIGGTGTITSSQLLEIAKESRQAADIGVLSTVRDLSQTGSTQTLNFPFENLSAAKRDSVAGYVRTMDTALSILFFANLTQNQGNTKPAVGDLPTDAELEAAAARVVLDNGFDACGLYPDWIAVRILNLVLDFRQRLESVDPNISIEGLKGEYAVELQGFTMTPTKAAAINTTITWIGTAVNGNFIPLLDPNNVGCALAEEIAEIIDTEKVRNFVNNTLNPSLRNYYINTGVAGNPGIGDNDGDGRIDEEIINGRDDDGDGLVDEDSRL